MKGLNERTMFIIIIISIHLEQLSLLRPVKNVTLSNERSLFKVRGRHGCAFPSPHMAAMRLLESRDTAIGNRLSVRHVTVIFLWDFTVGCCLITYKWQS